MTDQTRDRGMALREQHPTQEERDEAMWNLLGTAARCLGAELVPEALVTIIVRIPGHPEGDALLASREETLLDMHAVLDRTAQRVWEQEQQR